MIIGVVVLIACLWSTYGPQIPWLLSRALCCKPQNNVLASSDHQIVAMPTKPMSALAAVQGRNRHLLIASIQRVAVGIAMKSNEI